MSDLDRREFMANLGRYGAGACGLCALGGAGVEEAVAGDHPVRWTREIDFYERLPGRRIQCFVCPLHCVLEDGETCFCRTRTNVGGRLYTRAYNNPCILRVDPIEKMPLNHFRPGTQTLTISTGGCNLRCLYCQNWQQSQALPDELKTYDVRPEQAVQAARKRGVEAIAFNYTEPVAFLEYAKDIARAARKAEMQVVAATGAFIEPEPLIDFARSLDAVVVALKGFTGEFYKTVCGVPLDPVLAAIETIRNKTDCWLELVCLVVPTYNDDLDAVRRMCGWVRRTVGVNTPVHFARFVPMYRLANLPRTPVQTLESACAIARRAGLNYVYTSNIAPHDGNNTYCRRCRGSLVQRLGFKVLEDRLDDGRCPHCHTAVPGVWT